MFKGAGGFSRAVVCVLFFLIARGASAAQERILFRENFDAGPPKSWKEIKFEGRTEYSSYRDGSNTVLRAVARSSATGIAAEVNIDPSSGQVLSWRWKIDHTPAGANDKEKSSFDHTARLFVAFKTFIGPPRTINYVWANQAPAGKTFEHPSSGRSRWIALESGNAKAGQWVAESRNIAADWKTLFGDDTPPQIVGIGLMTDSDGTGQTVTGYYDDLQLAEPARK
jgi:hypothetical protein